MSGNEFPVSKKLQSILKTSENKRILIINGVECEPGLLHDEWLINNRFKEINQGIAYLKNALNLNKIIFASKLSITTPFSEYVETVKVPARYPMGEEHFLINQVLGIKLKNNDIPSEKGILVMNVQTIYQICKTINNSYDNGHFITLANMETGEAKITYMTPKSNIHNLLEKAFGKNNNNSLNVVIGKGLMATREIDKSELLSSEINFAALISNNIIDNNNKCRKCGKCSSKCPVKIDVSSIVQTLEKNPLADISMYHPEKCIHCSSCTYFCKASKNPTSYVNKL